MTREIEELAHGPALAAGKTLLVAESGDLRQHDVDLRLLAAQSDPSEGVAVVATKTSSEAVLADHELLETDDAADVLGVVDAVSHDQNLPASYRKTPISHVPGPQDVARISLAVADLTRQSEREDRRRHLVVQSLTPLLETSDLDVVCRFVRRATGDSAVIDGFSILTVDFTAHDERTMTRLRDLADFVLWVEESPDGTLDFEVEQVGPATVGRDG